MATEEATLSSHHASASSGDTQGISPNALCHIVLRTTAANYDRMVSFYVTLLGARITHMSHRLAFLSYDYEHHRIAILIDPKAHARTQDGPQVGLHHVAFGFPKLPDLVASYQLKKAAGILPVWCVNHGMSTSMYYEDPDQNEIEFQVDNFDTVKEAVDYMASPEFEENPVGVDFDAEAFVERVKSGESESAIKARPNIGPRSRK